MYTEIEQETLDIDCFFTDGKYIGFMTSCGGKLPDSVAGSKEEHHVLVNYFRSLPEISEVLVNSELDRLLIKIVGSGVDERYLEDYVSMTKKGLYSYDKTGLNNSLDSHYHLVASPNEPLKLESLPKDILNILSKTRFLNHIENFREINLLEID
ncbi:hypothetical protein [Chryseobacterium sp. SIMBA_028]|uniref:hypothetical protein n=1 Tax=Chryseobacterium sp. SIMBA_028 TaxID=3085771 RepID=UPI00397C54A5